MMNMTHYMELLAQNQPWNLLIFMGIPIVLAETVVVTELYVLYTRNFYGVLRLVNRWAGIVVGFYFLIAFLYLMATAAIPLTTGGGWRGPIDVAAVSFYLAGVVPLLGIARGSKPDRKLMIHASLVALFLVLGHVAMVFGMVDPTLATGEQPTTPHMH